jgi:hypothetical protein
MERSIAEIEKRDQLLLAVDEVIKLVLGESWTVANHVNMKVSLLALCDRWVQS